MLAPRQTGRPPPSLSDSTRRTAVDCRWVFAGAVARELVVVLVAATVSQRGGGRHPRGLLPALSALLDGEEMGWSRGDVIVLSRPGIVGGDVEGLAETSPTLPGDRG